MLRSLGIKRSCRKRRSLHQNQEPPPPEGEASPTNAEETSRAPRWKQARWAGTSSLRWFNFVNLVGKDVTVSHLDTWRGFSPSKLASALR